VTVEISIENKTATIKIAGRFDFSSQRDFRNAYKKDAEDAINFIVDLSETEYIDSSALGMLLLLNEHAESLNGHVKLSKPAPAIRDILSVANFEKLFEIVE
jgi:anti-anti-sigma factor